MGVGAELETTLKNESENKTENGHFLHNIHHAFHFFVKTKCTY
jgi:hypothetical protein